MCVLQLCSPTDHRVPDHGVTLQVKDKGEAPWAFQEGYEGSTWTGP